MREVSNTSKGPFNNYVTLQGEGGGVPGVTLCDREGGGGRGSVTYASKKNVV